MKRLKPTKNLKKRTDFPQKEQYSKDKQKGIDRVKSNMQGNKDIAQLKMLNELKGQGMITFSLITTRNKDYYHKCRFGVYIKTNLNISLLIVFTKHI